MKITKEKSLIKLLYLPNENPVITQSGPRTVFKEMVQNHLLDDYQVYSYMLEAAAINNSKKWERIFIDIIKEFKPTVLFWQHLGSFPLSSNLLTQIKNLENRPLVVYHEGDIYGKYRKNLTPSTKTLARISDITFLVGLGENAELFKKAGAKKIIYSPWCADTSLFGTKWEPYQQNRKDIVMIGNRIVSKTPILNNIKSLRLPGSVTRELLATKMFKRFGNRFKVYGSGWGKYPFSVGAIPFNEQENILRQNLLSVNWDHFPNTPFYFSDRLPNTLLSGVAHATNYHSGYELLFKNGEQLMYYHSVEEAVDLVDWMMSKPKKYLIELGLEGEKFVRKNLTVEIVYHRMISIIIEQLSSLLK